METEYCPKCFQKLNRSEAKHLCPSCGFDLAANPQPQNALPWGTVLHDRYIVGRVLGQGGFGITYIGFDTNLQCKVAIKEYYPRGVAVRDASRSHSLTWPTSQNTGEKERGCESFLREARKMARIGSVPGIVRVIDIFTENDTSYIIMDYLEGVTLRQYIRANGPVTFARCRELLHPLFEAIDELHAKGMIHRDISPDNIMIRDNGTVWLLDFGAAKDMAVGTEGESSMVVARSGFSPLEQYGSKNIGPWTDVYALCATIYYCVTGHTLPNANERAQDGDSIQWEPAQVPEDFQETIRDGLSIGYKNRIQNVSELMKRLDSVPTGGEKRPEENAGTKGRRTGDETEVVTGPGGDGGYSVVIDPFAEETAKQKRRELIKKVSAAAAAVLLLIGVAAFAFSRLGGGGTAEEAPQESVTAEAASAGAEESVEAAEENSEQAETGVPKTPDIPAPETTDLPASQSAEPQAPTPQPTAAPTQQPTAAPTPQPTAAPTPQPTPTPVPIVASGTCGANLTWQLDKSGVMTISGTGEMTDYEEARKVPWKYRLESIVSVVIEDGVSSVGDYAFYNCTKLTNVSIPNTVTKIGERSFSQCYALTSISLPSSLLSISSGAFAFSHALTDIMIPANVSSIGSGPFRACDSLRKISVSSGNANYCSENGVLYNKEKTVLIQYPGGSGSTSFTVPASVTRIGAWAFYRNQTLASVTVSGDRVDIEEYAFFVCTALTTVTVTGNGGSIATSAFSQCDKLTDAIFRGNAPEMHSYAFLGDTLTITYPANDSTWEGIRKQYSYKKDITWNAV